MRNQYEKRTNNNLLFTVLILIGLAILGRQFVADIGANYRYEKKYTQLWELSDKSSTIPAKQQYITQFVATLKTGRTNGEFADHNALFLKTPNNEFDANLKALETLAGRLNEIQGMDPSSFQYNTAIQQITAQEQGEAHQLLSVFQGCWRLNNCFTLWQWVGGIIVGIGVLFVTVGVIWWFIRFSDI